MIKKIIFPTLLILALVCSNKLQAQTSDKIAYINSVELLESVPGKIEATKAIEELNKKYKDELAIMQNEYNTKYTNFLANQNNLAESIKLRRMQELYELEQNINRFIKVAQEDVESQQKQLIEPLKEKMQEAIRQIGMEQGYTCIYDASNPAIAFITPDAIDANSLVRSKLLQGRR
ncbi:OmpH family outer membrane protein [Dysgonomonas macrotermitis]|uniref:Periplasmic chaperone for outer membrane proteins Skp n=1 Tax=Dysgonomonas macrotermitis TaxID=1346286 RepID=A0A1M5D8Q5_9BACT|nr:OmpH family outer membrane protein [Dysgonomonas macrotermitis]SHF63052.1 periplasmic chaperone for outer membrane proteins Skp [Dysgonomonas macrotermitis]